MNETINFYDRAQLCSKIWDLRKLGELRESIDICNKATKKFPNDYYYSKILGDLYFQEQNFSSSLNSYISFLKNIKFSKNNEHKNELFSQFVKRYYRLKRVLSEEEMNNFEEMIRSEVEQGNIDSSIISEITKLVNITVSYSEKISDDCFRAIKLINNDQNFKALIDILKKIEEISKEDTLLLLDQYVLNRERTERTFRIDSYCVSIYERLNKYDNAIKVAGELVAIKKESVAIRSFFRICRKIENYEPVDDLLSVYPEITKNTAFGVLYELVYYYGSKNEIEQVKLTLKKMKNQHVDSIPINKTLRNFYLQYGLLDEAKYIKDHIEKLESKRGDYVKNEFSSEIRESEESIWTVIKDLRTKLEHQEHLVAMSDLTKGISHELGQPITNIRYTVQLYQRIFSSKIEQELVLKVFDSILEETDRMGRLISRLAPITSSKSINITFNITEIIQKRVYAEYPRLQQLKTEVVMYPDKPVYLFADPTIIEQIFSNLLINAIYAIEQKGTDVSNQITIRLSETQDEVKIIFADTGVGISKKDSKKIFDPFYSTKPPGKGEGLGLFIVWNILKMYEGKIVLDKNYVDGAKFIITIPRRVKDEK